MIDKLISTDRQDFNSISLKLDEIINRLNELEQEVYRWKDLRALMVGYGFGYCSVGQSQLSIGQLSRRKLKNEYPRDQFS